MTAHRATSPFLSRHGTFSAAEDEWAVAAPDCHWPPQERRPRDPASDPELPRDAHERLNRLLLGEYEWCLCLDNVYPVSRPIFFLDCRQAPKQTCLFYEEYATFKHSRNSFNLL